MRYFYSRYWGILSHNNPEAAQSTLDVGFVGFGYSGNFTCLNDIHKENQPNVGPLPRGLYKVVRIYDDPHKGRHTCVLEPDPTNKMYGRAGFLCHGDTPTESHNASDGCIIMPLWIRSLFEVGDEIEVL